MNVSDAIIGYVNASGPFVIDYWMSAKFAGGKKIKVI